MNRNPSRIVVVHVSRKKSFQQRRLKKQHNNENLQSKRQNLNKSQSNIACQSSLNSTRFSNVSVHRSGLLSNATKTIINSKQNKIHNEEQNNQIFVRADDENNRSNLSDSIRNFVPTNLNTNDSTLYFDISNIHPSSFNCVHRITPINTQGLLNDDFVIDFYKNCCYQAISIQLSIEFKLIEQVSVWHIDDVSMTQGNGELINNGGFEMNFTGWTISSSANLSITSLAYYSPSAAHTGSIHLYSTALSTPDKIK
ncbi:unnamed protein product [Adineta steineri]|uniref:Uncharacterized protein n=1 Tax=Adineta steineri TaxID=433720 RepID=A0A818ILK3_9BILA|nr:unnamed protein product [Adineta steineri]CAF3521814.1 unnamed protein product [Adineta steineri]